MDMDLKTVDLIRETGRQMNFAFQVYKDGIKVFKKSMKMSVKNHLSQDKIDFLLDCKLEMKRLLKQELDRIEQDYKKKLHELHSKQNCGRRKPKE